MQLTFKVIPFTTFLARTATSEKGSTDKLRRAWKAKQQLVTQSKRRAWEAKQQLVTQSKRETFLSKSTDYTLADKIIFRLRDRNIHSKVVWNFERYITWLSLQIKNFWKQIHWQSSPSVLHFKAKLMLMLNSWTKVNKNTTTTTTNNNNSKILTLTSKAIITENIFKFTNKLCARKSIYIFRVDAIKRSPRSKNVSIIRIHMWGWKKNEKKLEFVCKK